MCWDMRDEGLSEQGKVQLTCWDMRDEGLSEQGLVQLTCWDMRDFLNKGRYSWHAEIWGMRDFLNKGRYSWHAEIWGMRDFLNKGRYSWHAEIWGMRDFLNKGRYSWHAETWGMRDFLNKGRLEHYHADCLKEKELADATPSEVQNNFGTVPRPILGVVPDQETGQSLCGSFQALQCHPEQKLELSTHIIWHISLLSLDGTAAILAGGFSFHSSSPQEGGKGTGKNLGY